LSKIILIQLISSQPSSSQALSEFKCCVKIAHFFTRVGRHTKITVIELKTV
jgi:hypothetical protein